MSDPSPTKPTGIVDAANYDTVVRCLDTCMSVEKPAAYPPTKFGYWVENMHAYSYVYRHAERGRLPKPELTAD